MALHHAESNNDLEVRCWAPEPSPAKAAPPAGNYPSVNKHENLCRKAEKTQVHEISQCVGTRSPRWVLPASREQLQVPVCSMWALPRAAQGPTAGCLCIEPRFASSQKPLRPRNWVQCTHAPQGRSVYMRVLSISSPGQHKNFWVSQVLPFQLDLEPAILLTG